MEMNPEAYNMLPEHMRDAMRNYVEYGIEPGDFLRNVLCNNLFGALERADDVNKHRLWDYGLFLYNCAPSRCKGSPEAYKYWLSVGGMEGLNRARSDSDA